MLISPQKHMLWVLIRIVRFLRKKIILQLSSNTLLISSSEWSNDKWDKTQRAKVTDHTMRLGKTSWTNWYMLTHICPVDFSILNDWTSPFPNLGVFRVLFHFYSISNRNSCKQTMQTLVRRRILRRLIWVCTVCLGPKNGTLGLYGLCHKFGPMTPVIVLHDLL